MNFNDLLSRLYPKAWKEKTRVDYSFNFDDQTWQYNIVIRNTMAKSWWIQLIRAMNNMTIGQNKIQLLEEFDVTHDRLRATMREHLRPTLEKIVQDIRKDPNIPRSKTMKLLTCNCDRIHFKTIDAQNVKSEIYLSGVCSV